MNILFLHRNFPAQFRHLLEYLVQHDHKVAYITNRQDAALKKVIFGIYQLNRKASPKMHRYLREYEESILHGQAAADVALDLKKKGFVPDVIFGHSWGPISFMKDVLPNVPLIGHFEWFYHSENSDVDFASTTPPSLDTRARIRVKNSHLLLDLYSCDHGMVPTKWQLSQIPTLFHHKLSCIHEGIRTHYFKPDPTHKGLHLPSVKLHIPENTEIITYVTRGMEAYRGFPQFMEAVQLLLQRHPTCHVVIVGEDRVCYGAQLPKGQTYKKKMLEALDLDLQRVHFTGPLVYNDYLKVLQASWAHIYLTYPFVLSWSALEAMSTECLLIASNTPPVLEFVQDKQNGLLVDFFSPEAIANQTLDVLKNPKDYAHIRKAARNTILQKCALKDCLPKQLALLEHLINTFRN